MKLSLRISALCLCMIIVASLSAVFSYAVSESNYNISVNGFAFTSNVDASGNGWEYDHIENTLNLDNYTGNSIIALGNLNIVCHNSVIVNGRNSTKYTSASCGIVVTGTLVLTVSGDTVISGGNVSNANGGDGLVGGSVTIKTDPDAKLTINGGAGSTAGGHGIRANALNLETKFLEVNGGAYSSALYFSSEFNVMQNSFATFNAGYNSSNAITYLQTAKYTFASDIVVTFKGGNQNVSLVSKNYFLYGDIFTDRNVNVKDAVTLAQYLAKWSLNLSANELAAADVYYDGAVNAKDAVKLAQYLAKWNVVLGN